MENLGQYNYWLAIVIMMVGFYGVIDGRLAIGKVLFKQLAERCGLIGRSGFHGLSSLAAVLTAALIRGYVPQRQIFHIPSRTSSSEGSGFSFNKAQAVMICPTWQ